MNHQKFIQTILKYYKTYGRDLPWRNLSWNTKGATYSVVVSEIMLQQTQAPRVAPRFIRFIKRFPDWQTLAKAKTSDVLREWQGLGYNRRALYLKSIAEKATTRIQSGLNPLPNTYDELRAEKLPGIGPNTAGAILAYAFNTPHPFIETNIRTVFIHHFFKTSRKKVSDEDILELVAQTLTDPRVKKNPREWYYALMDYGTKLKQELRSSPKKDSARKSVHYKKQSTFKGSNRELRAELLRHIIHAKTSISEDELIQKTIAKDNKHRTSENIIKNLNALLKEGFTHEKSKKYFSK